MGQSDALSLSELSQRDTVRGRLSNESQCSSVFALKVVAGPDSHLHSVMWPRWISLILN